MKYTKPKLLTSSSSDCFCQDGSGAATSTGGVQILECAVGIAYDSSIPVSICGNGSGDTQYAGINAFGTVQDYASSCMAGEAPSY
jgi:hypothetical protein